MVARFLTVLSDERADCRVLEVGEAVEFTDEAFVDVAEVAMGAVGEVGGSEVGGEGAAGDFSEVGWVAVQGGGGEKDEVSGVEDHAAGFVAGHDGDGAHFGGEVGEGDPGGEHLLGGAGEPAGFFSVPVVFRFS